jgi:hypothetical protein
VVFMYCGSFGAPMLGGFNCRMSCILSERLSSLAPITDKLPVRDRLRDACLAET